MAEPTAGPSDRCAQCGGRDLTKVPMVLTDGTSVVFVSCQGCECRQWLREQDGAWVPLPISAVIQRSARRPS
jgi:hypothetical protein